MSSAESGELGIQVAGLIHIRHFAIEASKTQLFVAIELRRLPQPCEGFSGPRSMTNSASRDPPTRVGISSRWPN